MVTNRQEYEYGVAREILLKPVLERFCGKTLIDTKRWDTYDFKGEDVTIELKSRKNPYNQYPTTIVGMNKIDEIQVGETIYFFFNFTDGLYYWEYKENDYNVIMIQRRDRQHIPAKPHLSIPITDLVKLEY